MNVNVSSHLGFFFQLSPIFVVLWILIKKGLDDLEKFVRIVLIEVEFRDEKLGWLFQINGT